LICAYRLKKQEADEDWLRVNAMCERAIIGRLYVFISSSK